MMGQATSAAAARWLANIIYVRAENRRRFIAQNVATASCFQINKR